MLALPTGGLAGRSLSRSGAEPWPNNTRYLGAWGQWSEMQSIVPHNVCNQLVPGKTYVHAKLQTGLVRDRDISRPGEHDQRGCVETTTVAPLPFDCFHDASWLFCVAEKRHSTVVALISGRSLLSLAFCGLCWAGGVGLHVEQAP